MELVTNSIDWLNRSIDRQKTSAILQGSELRQQRRAFFSGGAFGKNWPFPVLPAGRFGSFFWPPKRKNTRARQENMSSCNILKSKTRQGALFNGKRGESYCCKDRIMILFCKSRCGQDGTIFKTVFSLTSEKCYSK